ncbi:hypothetical protein ACVI1J_003306 [Bradyrhizobium diazoefficiens]
MMTAQLVLDSLRPRQKTTYVDKLGLHLPGRLSEQQLNFVRVQSSFAEQFLDLDRRRRGKVLLTVVRPLPAALKILSQLPHSISYLEVALDVSFDDPDHPPKLHALFKEHFVQGWHSRQTGQDNGTTYTGPRMPGRWFTAYSDEPDRNQGHQDCFHIEARHTGARAVSRAGVSSAGDLLTFDHVAFWQSNLQLFCVNLDRLGRFHENRRLRRKRHRSRIEKSGRLRYNVDRSVGAVLFRNHSYNPFLDLFTVDAFVQSYGRGPFLAKLDATNLLP